MISRTLTIAGEPTLFEVLPPGEYNPAKTGGTVRMTRAGEVREIYLDLGRLPLDQQNLDERDAELLEQWWITSTP